MTFKAIEGLLPDNIVQLFHTFLKMKIKAQQMTFRQDIIKI